MKKRTDWTRIIVMVLIVGAILFGIKTNSQSGDTPRAGFSDASPLGGKGLRLMLENQGYKVTRQADKLQSMPGDAKIWLLLNPDTAFTRDEGKKLVDWVRKGGVLLMCVRPNSFFSMGRDRTSEGIIELEKSLSVQADEFRSGQATDDLMPAMQTLDLNAVSIYRTGVTKASGSLRTVSVNRDHLGLAGAEGKSLSRLDVGKGRVFVLPDALLLTNYALSKDDNATLVLNLLRVHSPSGTAYFDERNHGDKVTAQGQKKSLISYLKQPPISYAILQLILAGLCMWAFAGRRLGKPVPILGQGPVTRASQFAAAMGSLFAKTNRPKAAADIIAQRFRRRLAKKLGMSPAESDAVLAKRAEELAGIPFAVTDRLLLQCQAPAESAAEALQHAQEMEAVLSRLDHR